MLGYREDVLLEGGGGWRAAGGDRGCWKGTGGPTADRSCRRGSKSTHPQLQARASRIQYDLISNRRDPRGSCGRLQGKRSRMRTAGEGQVEWGGRGCAEGGGDLYEQRAGEEGERQGERWGHAGEGARELCKQGRGSFRGGGDCTEVGTSIWLSEFCGSSLRVRLSTAASVKGEIWGGGQEPRLSRAGVDSARRVQRI